MTYIIKDRSVLVVLVISLLVLSTQVLTIKFCIQLTVIIVCLGTNHRQCCLNILIFSFLLSFVPHFESVVAGSNGGLM